MSGGPDLDLRRGPLELVRGEERLGAHPNRRANTFAATWATVVVRRNHGGTLGAQGQVCRQPGVRPRRAARMISPTPASMTRTGNSRVQSMSTYWSIRNHAPSRTRITPPTIPALPLPMAG